MTRLSVSLASMFRPIKSSELRPHWDHRTSWPPQRNGPPPVVSTAAPRNGFLWNRTMGSLTVAGALCDENGTVWFQRCNRWKTPFVNSESDLQVFWKWSWVDYEKIRKGIIKDSSSCCQRSWSFCLRCSGLPAQQHSREWMRESQSFWWHAIQQHTSNTRHAIPSHPTLPKSWKM